MSVTFNRAQLVKVANEAIAQHDKARAEYDRAVAKFKAAHVAENTAVTRERAKSLRDGLTRLLKSSGPIWVSDVRELVGGTHYITDRFYGGVGTGRIRDNVAVPEGLLTPAQVIETKALLKVLGAATGDTVSANELKLLGLKNLGPIFTAAAGQNAAGVGR